MSNVHLATRATLIAMVFALCGCTPESVDANRVRQMQAAYEGRIERMQLAYDELNGLIVLAEERFKNVAQELDEKNRRMETMVFLLQRMHQQARRIECTSALSGNPTDTTVAPKRAEPAKPVANEPTDRKKEIARIGARLVEIERAQDALLRGMGELGRAQIEKSIRLLCRGSAAAR